LTANDFALGPSGFALRMTENKKAELAKILTLLIRGWGEYKLTFSVN